MRHGSSNRRQRNRGNGGRRGNQKRTQVFDSNGPDVRIRGTAYQIVEKYVALAKDAAASDDIVLHQSYLQHAEHYQRIISEFQEDVREGQSSGKRSRNEQQKSGKSEEDLALPASILGEPSKAESEQADKERTAELSTS